MLHSDSAAEAEAGGLISPSKRRKHTSDDAAGTPLRAANTPRRATNTPYRAGKRFEMWVSLSVGLGDCDLRPTEGGSGLLGPAFQGAQVFSVRSAVLKRAGSYFRCGQ